MWHASGRNQGKTYAVVEYKSDFERDMPAFLKKKPGTQRKPGSMGKLGVSGVPKVEDMLATEPAEPAPSPSKGTVRRDGAKRGKAGSSPSKAAPAASSSNRNSKGPVVQMSEEWIQQNLLAAVGIRTIVDDIELRGYSRHLIYTPLWLPATAQHMKSHVEGKSDQEATHRDHGVLENLHYEEKQVKSAVNKKKAYLRKKYPTASTLKVE